VSRTRIAGGPTLFENGRRAKDDYGKVLIPVAVFIGRDTARPGVLGEPSIPGAGSFSRRMSVSVPNPDGPSSVRLHCSVGTLAVF
jgi:hypothetical protein